MIRDRSNQPTEASKPYSKPKPTPIKFTTGKPKPKPKSDTKGGDEKKK